MPVQYTAFEAGREGIAQHRQGFFVAARGEGVEAAIGARDAHVLSLSSVGGIAQNPAAVATVGIHPFSTEITPQACSDARDYDPVSNVKLRNASSGLVDYTNPFVAEDASVGHGRKVPL